MSRLCVIPARGGSTRIPRKNIKLFLGRPLIAYSIEKALESGLFSRVVVSTDDEEIAQTAQKYGAEVPFLRDKSLADNYISSYAAVVDAYDRLKDDPKNDSPIDIVACIYATAPLMQLNELRTGFALMQERDADYLYSVCEFPFPIQRAVYLDAENAPHPFMPDCMPMRSQDLRKAYQDAAQFYFYKAAVLHGGIKKAVAYPISRLHVVDIDTPEDFALAEALAQALGGRHD